MKQITTEALQEHRPFFDAATQIATKATCLRAKCGAVIVKDGMVIGEGYNQPPGGDESQRMCNKVWDYTKKPKYDLTCCVHAEWAAVLDACKRNADKVAGATLYFMRIDDNGGLTDAGPPYCTTCSRFTMEAGVIEFALWNNDGASIYPIGDYNQASYAYYK